ncbi:MAG TPA: hypothetical protein EYH03_01245 [Chromatiales bacterium]|nr:hypothetical protein [Chromatiales bacterium]
MNPHFALGAYDNCVEVFDKGVLWATIFTFFLVAPSTLSSTQMLSEIPDEIMGGDAPIEANSSYVQGIVDASFLQYRLIIGL